MRGTPVCRDEGSAIIEFVFLAVVIMVPLIYLVAAVATVQRSTLAVTEAARNAGRAFATSDTEVEATVRAGAAVRLALSDQGLPNDATVRFVAAVADCAGSATAPRLQPGAEFAVCVTRHVALPGVPTILTGRSVTLIGRYVVHVDDFRAGPRR